MDTAADTRGTEMGNLTAAIVMEAIAEAQFNRGYEMGRTIAAGTSIRLVEAQGLEAVKAYRQDADAAWNASPSLRLASFYRQEVA